jgi:hypothetical protein
MNFLIIDVEGKLGESFKKFFPPEHTVDYNIINNIEYDVVFIECDLCKVNHDIAWNRWWRGWSNNPQDDYLSDKNLQHIVFGSSEQYANKFHNVFKLLKNAKYTKCVILNLNDQAVVSSGISWLESNNYKVDLVLQREYRRTHIWDYNEKIRPFPFMTFDKISRDILYDSTEYNMINLESKDCFFIGDASHRMEVGMSDEWVNRFDFLKICEKIGCLKWYKQRLPHDLYLELYRKHRSFLHLNGPGHLCKRFFEGYAKGCVCILQEMDVIFPFGSPVHESLIVKVPEQLKMAIEKLDNNDTYYEDCFNYQKSIIDNYFNRKYVFSYIMNLL